MIRKMYTGMISAALVLALFWGFSADASAQPLRMTFDEAFDIALDRSYDIYQIRMNYQTRTLHTRAWAYWM